MDKDTQKSFFTKESAISLWEAGIRWAGHEVGQVGQYNIPVAVQDAFRSLMEGQLHGALKIVSPQGNLAGSKGPEQTLTSADGTTKLVYPDEQKNWELLLGTVQTHEEALAAGDFNRYHLDHIFLYPREIGTWALEKGLPFPDFCFSADQRKELEKEYAKEKLQPEDIISDSSQRITKDIADFYWGRLKDAQKFRLMARDVAKNLWEQDENLTIAAICENEFIKRYCGGNYYTNKDTVRDWIKDLDPRDPSTRVGRRKAK